MLRGWRTRGRREAALPPDVRLRVRYESCRVVIALNNDALELLAGLQEDLLYAPSRLDLFGDRVTMVFDKVEATIAALATLGDRAYPRLVSVVAEQRREVERYLADQQEMVTPRLAARLSEIGLGAAPEVGDKAAVLGELRNQVGCPVPEGYVLTTEAYRQFCGVPCWRHVRDAVRSWDADDLDGLSAIARDLTGMVLDAPMPRAVEVALTERAAVLESPTGTLAVRSSAVGEGGLLTFAGQFHSRINVTPPDVVSAYREVVASRFSERALAYRLSTGIAEVDTPMAVLVLAMVPARTAGILYTRDPRDPKADALLVTATWGLGLDVASGLVPADLYVVSRAAHHRVLERQVVPKMERAVAHAGGGVERRAVDPGRVDRPSLSDDELGALARWALAIERHLGVPQDIEWAIGEDGRVWILQARPLALSAGAEPAPRLRVRAEPVLKGGRPVHPGRVSGPAFLVEDLARLNETPHGAVVFLRRVSPDIVKVFPRISGLVAEGGNVTGHAAALLREFKIPSAFELPDAFALVRTGDQVSLDAGQARVYAGVLWPPPAGAAAIPERFVARRGDPLSRRLLALTLIDPSAFNFRPGGCRSAHDVLRFCHEKAIQGMFTLNDAALQEGAHRSSRLLTAAPLNLHVLDLGGGLAAGPPGATDVRPSDVTCRPFQALWRGVTHPGVNWNREMDASFSGLASVMAGSLSASMGATRALGQRSYLLVTHDYMNLNSRLAYHFTLVDACVADVPGQNYISFRFAGGGATRWRRDLRGCFLESCLAHYGFHVDRRGDVVNAWFKKAPAEETEARLDVLGRLLACASQLDMYMTGHDAVRWYVEQFLAGNYAFVAAPGSAGGGPGGGPGRA